MASTVYFGPNEPRTLEKVSLEYVSSHNSLMLQFVYTYNRTFHIQMFFQPHMINTCDMMNIQTLQIPVHIP